MTSSILNLLFFRFLFCPLLCLFTSQQALGYRASYGGSKYGHESSLYQQVAYAQSVLPNLLSTWNLTLLPQTILVDSERSLSGEKINRFVPHIRGQIIFFSYIHRSVRFFAQNPTGQLFSGSIYLVEEIEDKQRPFLPRNSTVRDVIITRNNLKVRFSLASSFASSNFKFELSHRDFNFQPQNSPLFFGASSEQMISYTYNQLQFILNPHGLQLIPNSLDVAYYTDYGRIYRFPDRKGHLVSFLAIDAAGKLLSGSCTLWESHAQHKAISYPRNSTIKTLRSSLSGQPTELWLVGKGPSNVDSSIEVSIRDFWLQTVPIPRQRQ